ncbi:MAG: hypothetical protein GX419_12745 [Bacteroidales bacterium]|nr:hypothetical protein [Bacteroidales bacterium]
MQFSVLHLTDLHGNVIFLSQWEGNPLRPDMVLLTGDITHFGEEPEAKKIVDAVRTMFPHVLALHGNCDKPGVEQFLVSQNISLHRKFRIIQEVTFLGVGGSLPCPGTTPSEYSDNLYKNWLEETYENAGKPKKFVLVTHQPPYGTRTDKAMKLVHTGSQSIREFIELTSPLLCLCGHIHESAGTDRIGNTILVNPGPFKQGHFAYITLNDEQIDVVIK